MSPEKLYKAAFPHGEDILALPVEDLDQATRWYGVAFGMAEVERRDDPVPAVVLERDGKKYQVFFVVAPDRLCYYFHRPLENSG